MNIAYDLLARIESAGGSAEVDNGMLSLTAPEPLPEDLMVELREHKDEILNAMDEISHLSHSEFENQGKAVAIRVPNLEGPVWIVPTVKEAAVLIGEGIPRSRVLTTRFFKSLSGLTGEEILSILEVIFLFDGQVSEVRKIPIEREP